MRCTARILLALGVAWASSAKAATYLPISDADLARRSPLIVYGRVVSQSVRVEAVGERTLPFTITTVRVAEVLKGTLAGGVVQVRLPGGRFDDAAWSVPGTPLFQIDEDVILMLRAGERAAESHLSEFGLSRFDIVRDESGRGFAVRPAFAPEENAYLSGRAAGFGEPTSAATAAAPLRDAVSFMAALRASGSERPMPEVAYAQPIGALSLPGGGPVAGRQPLWVNIGGVEGTQPLARWFWDTGTSPTAVVFTSGAQTNLSDGSNGLAHVQNAVDRWHGVAATDVRYTGISGTGNLSVTLDAAQSFDGGTAWNTPLSCAQGGVIGLGGPSGFGSLTFKGDANYFAATAGTVTMRPRTGGVGCYPAAIFRSTVLHEMGHTLGLGHPDQGQTSTHSTTTPADWAASVMAAVAHPPFPDTPQVDDLQAIQFYYGASTAGACTPTSTALCLNSNRFRVAVTWTKSDGTTGAGQAISLTGDTGYFWFFSSNNVEMVIKVVDGRALNSRFWVFAGGLTNVNVVITITDTQTGAVKTYVNPQNTAFQPIQDTAAFVGMGATTSAVSTSEKGEAVPTELASLVEIGAAPASSEAACAIGATTLCLNSARFRVGVTWTKPDGTTGAGQAVSLTGDTGYFWFFSSNNVEMVIKVVDGRPLNSRFWVFAGGLTNVNVVITAIDTQTGAVKIYVNPQNTAFQPIQDTGAFAGP